MATIKQKEAFNKIAENHGNVSKTMLEVGYSQNTAKKPSNLTNSKGWIELMEKYLPDEDLIKVHKEGLALKPSNPTRHKYLETGYKIKGKLNETREIILNQNLIKITPEKEKELLDKFKLKDE